MSSTCPVFHRTHAECRPCVNCPLKTMANVAQMKHLYTCGKGFSDVVTQMHFKAKKRCKDSQWNCKRARLPLQWCVPLTLWWCNILNSSMPFLFIAQDRRGASPCWIMVWGNATEPLMDVCAPPLPGGATADWFNPELLIAHWLNVPSELFTWCSLGPVFSKTANEESAPPTPPWHTPSVTWTFLASVIQTTSENYDKKNLITCWWLKVKGTNKRILANNVLTQKTIILWP